MKAEPGLRVVIDTNVWISAALSPRGAPAAVVRHVLAHGIAVFTAATFDELRTRLWKPKFDRWLSLPTRQQLLHDLNAAAHWVEVDAATAARSYSRDASDDAFIHAALAAQAAWLVTGDDDLLSVDAATLPVRIVSPAQVLAEPGFMVG